MNNLKVTRIKNLFIDKKGRSKILIAGILLVVGLLLVTTILALTDEEKQQLELEKAQLESELVSEGYDWLINYSGVVDNVFVENYSCNETGEQCNVVIDGKIVLYDIYLKKLQIDKLRGELNG